METEILETQVGGSDGIDPPDIETLQGGFKPEPGDDNEFMKIVTNGYAEHELIAGYFARGERDRLSRTIELQNSVNRHPASRIFAPRHKDIQSVAGFDRGQVINIPNGRTV